MSDTTITALPPASGIDGTVDWLAIDRTSLGATQKINRQTFLGVTGQPMDISSSQSVTNKTLDNTNTITLKDTLFTLQDDGDTTKQARFQLSGITTATTRTYTLPNASSTLADISSAQTLTNKTLTSPVITGGSIMGTTITTDAIVGQSSATSGTVYGLSIASAKISGTSITNATITTTQIAASTVAASNINFGGAGTGVWWEEVARTTLVGSSLTITLSTIPARKYLYLVWTLIPTGGTINPMVQFNSDTAANYASRLSVNGGADTTVTTQIANFLDVSGAQNLLMYGYMNILNILAQEKVNISFASTIGAAGAGTAPTRREQWQKWTNTSAQITSLVITTPGAAGSFAIGSEVVVLGHN